MARLRRRHGHAPALGDFAPLVDVTLMLVVFLLLTAEVVDHGIPVQLPSVATGAPQEARALAVTITDDGTVLVAGRTVRLEDLGAMIADHDLAVLHADRDASHGRVLAVVDRLRDGGLEGIYYATDPEPTGVTDW